MNAEEKKLFYRELKKIAVPLALQHFLSALVGASDALMLGRLTQDAIAAVSLANQISFVMLLFNVAVIGGVNVLIAQYWGKKDFASARKLLAMALRYAAVISFAFFLLAFSLPEELMRIFTTEKELIRIGGEYLRIVSFSYLFAGLAQCLLTMMRVTGHAKTSLRISLVTVLIDMTADFFLIYGVGLGANGSAYSTIAVEAAALCWCLIWMRKKPDYRLDRGTLFFFSKTFEKDAWKIIPGMLASSLSWGLSMTMHAFILGRLGSDATAANSVTGVAQQLIQCVSQGLASGAGIMIGGLLGQNMLDKARAYGKQFWRVALWSGLLNVGLIGAAGPLVYVFYVLEPQAKIYLVQMLMFSALYLFALAYNAIITCGVFIAGGDSRYDAISVFFATWCFALPLALLGCFVWHWPVMPVYIVMCLDEIVKAPFIRRRYQRYLWLKNLTRENAQGSGFQNAN